MKNTYESFLINDKICTHVWMPNLKFIYWMDSNDQGNKTQQSVLTMQYAVFFLRTPHSWFADVNHVVFTVCQKNSICIWIRKWFKESKGGPLPWLIDKARTFVRLYVTIGRQTFLRSPNNEKVGLYILYYFCWTVYISHFCY